MGIIVACHACLAYLSTEICKHITCNSWTNYKYSIRLPLQQVNVRQLKKIKKSNDK